MPRWDRRDTAHPTPVGSQWWQGCPSRAPRWPGVWRQSRYLPFRCSCCHYSYNEVGTRSPSHVNLSGPRWIHLSQGHLISRVSLPLCCPLGLCGGSSCSDVPDVEGHHITRGLSSGADLPVSPPNIAPLLMETPSLPRLCSPRSSRSHLTSLYRETKLVLVLTESIKVPFSHLH